MVNESEDLVGNVEILGGIKSAVSRGETLKDAMMTFYQAGYEKSEIEKAARDYINERNGAVATTLPSKPLVNKPMQQKEKKKEKVKPLSPMNLPKPLSPSAKPASGNFLPPKNPVPQKVSSYEPPKKKTTSKRGVTITIILAIVLLLLLGLLVAVVLFKGQLVNFFNSLLNKGG